MKYYFSSSNGKGHGIHSPFVFEFITNILNDKVKKKEYAIVASLRRQLQQDHSVITVDDFGAGSGITKTNQRSIASIA
ncbi:MAG: SAM-dependent methyltransferase, partial [Chitinophagaceae bacterium]|nr:SAM-dependent methyltransferase [Chitinophagaceae bacterium]